MRNVATHRRGEIPDSRDRRRRTRGYPAAATSERSLHAVATCTIRDVTIRSPVVGNQPYASIPDPPFAGARMQIRRRWNVTRIVTAWCEQGSANETMAYVTRHHHSLRVQEH